MKTLLAFLFIASPAIAAGSSKNVDAYFKEFEQCRADGGNASDAHCKAMKVSETKAKAEGCLPAGIGVSFHFERTDKTEC